MNKCRGFVTLFWCYSVIVRHRTMTRQQIQQSRLRLAESLGDSPTDRPPFRTLAVARPQSRTAPCRRVAQRIPAREAPTPRATLQESLPQPCRLSLRCVASIRVRFDQRLQLSHPPQIRRHQGVSLRDCQRQYGIAPPHAVRADGAAEQEFDGVPHTMPHFTRISFQMSDCSWAVRVRSNTRIW